jgi:ribonucleoside-diphosphate reductase alpha chain
MTQNGEISLCILSAINIGKLRKLEDLEHLCDLAVRALDELIDYQGILSRQQKSN